MQTEELREKTLTGGWLRGLSRAVPITLGYVPIGFAYGVLAQKAGLSAYHTLAMSIFVYAGSSQLIAVGLFAAGSAPLSIILTTFIVNLRHMLMASALAPYLSRWNKPILSAFAFEITDESFALHSVEFPRVAPLGGPDAAESLALNMTAQISWVLGTWLGLVAGGLITDIKLFALDYALPAMFIALLMMQLKDRVQLFVALVTGILAVALLLFGLDQWNVIVATIIGATIGVLVEEWNKTRSS